MKVDKPTGAKRPIRKKRIDGKSKERVASKEKERNASFDSSLSAADRTDRISERRRGKKRILKKRVRFNEAVVLPKVTDEILCSRTSAWVSPDGVYCNTAYAASYVGRSVSRLQSWRCEGLGPKYIKHGYSVFYRTADVKEFMENG